MQVLRIRVAEEAAPRAKGLLNLGLVHLDAQRLTGQDERPRALSSFEAALGLLQRVPRSDEHDELIGHVHFLLDTSREEAR